MRLAAALVLGLCCAASAQDGPFKDSGDAPAAAGKPAEAPASAAPISPNDTAEGGPTVVCDGKGRYRVDMKGKEILPHGACLRKHELSHVKDLEQTCPAGCKDQADGVPHPWDNAGGRCPAFAPDGAFMAWRKRSECKAYAVERACLKELFERAPDDLKGRIRARIKSVKHSLAYWKCDE